MTGDRRVLGGLMAAAIASVAVVPFVLRAQDPVTEQRRQQIQAMTQVDRDRLQRNEDRFRQMSPAEQERMRQLHGQLQEDRVTGRGRHVAVMHTYWEWLQSISLHRRDELQQETDPLRRLQRVREIVQQQRDGRLEARVEGAREYGRIGEVLGPLPLLSDSDFQAMLQILERRIVSPRARAQLDAYEGVRRSLKMMELLSRQRQPLQPLQDMLDEATLQAMIEAVSDAAAREPLQSLPEAPAARANGLRGRAFDPRDRPASFQMRRLKLVLTVHKNVERWLESERPRLLPSSADLEAFFETLPEEDQDVLLAMAPDEFRAQLHRRFIQQELQEHDIDLGRVKQFLRPARPSRDGEAPAGRPRPPFPDRGSRRGDENRPRD